MVHEDRIFRPRLAPWVFGEAGDGAWSRTRKNDRCIHWSFTKWDAAGNPCTFGFYMTEVYIYKVGARQARWEVAQNLRILRDHMRQLMGMRNDIIEAQLKGKLAWH